MLDPLTARWIEELNPRARSLHSLYETGKDRAATYVEMVEEILAPVRAGRDVCAAFYGHPGVFAEPGHEAIGRARAEGFSARMLPGISAEDCLFADLAIDPGQAGCQTYEATDFLLRAYRVETSALLVLWQVGFLGQVATPASPPRLPLDVLAERLSAVYPADHEVILYEAAPYPTYEPAVDRLPLSALGDREVSPMATLVVPPARRAPVDVTMLDRLEMRRR